MAVDDRIVEVHLTNFKAFDRFRLRLQGNAFLVGPNNAGKSTLISAIRSAGHMLRLASSKPPDRAAADKPTSVAYSFVEERIGIVDQNLRHEFREAETRLVVRFTSRAQIVAVWPSADPEDEEETTPYFYLDVPDGRQPRRPKEVRSVFPSVGIIPMLSPLELDELRLSEAHVRQNVEGRLASRHFRNQLEALRAQFAEDECTLFDHFVAFAEPWLPELELVELRDRAVPGEGRLLDLFYREPGRRALKEIAWAGDGVQVWLQLLYHLFRLRDADVIILDEPDLYLHADLQRRLVRVLEEVGAQVVTATHSPEMLAEADREAVVWVDKSRRQSVRAPKREALEALANALGSQFNIRLAKALRARTVLFVEGEDIKTITSVAKTVGATRLARESGVAVLQLQGFTNWEHVEPFKWLVDDFLAGAVDVFVVLDRDYRQEPEVTAVEARLTALGVHGHVWRRKELESYLLVPEVVQRVSGAPLAVVERLLDKVLEGMRGAVFARALDAAQQFQVAAKQHRVTVTEAFTTSFDAEWVDPARRLAMCPAKEVVRTLNQRLVAEGHRAVTARKLASTLRPSEVDVEMVELLERVESSLGRGL